MVGWRGSRVRNPAFGDQPSRANGIQSLMLNRCNVVISLGLRFGDARGPLPARLRDARRARLSAPSTAENVGAHKDSEKRHRAAIAAFAPDPPATACAS